MSVCFRWPTAVALTALILLGPNIAFADEGEDDHEVARELYEHGDIRSLETILSQLKIPGEVVAINLVRIGDRWVYRFQAVAPDGKRSVVDVDAGAANASMQEGDD